jgi:hypothetical protein
LETILAKTYKQVNAQGIIGGDLVRSLRLMLTVTSISLICILCCSLVSALNQDEASVSMFWSSQTVYPADTVSIRITFKSNYAEQLRIYNIGLHFDWMPPESFSGHDLSDNPVTIPSQGTYIFDPIVIQIPLNASAGSYSYFVGIEGTEGISASNFSWNSSSFTIQVHSIMEKIYKDLLPNVENKLNGAISANYESSEAQSLLQQAQSAFSNATSSANDGRWSLAIEGLEIADDYLDQASEAEQRSDEQRAALQNLLVYVAIIAIVVIIVASIIFVVVRRRRKQTDSGADQPVETIEEQSEEQG